MHIIAESKKTSLGYEFVTGVDGRELDLADPGIVEASFATRAFSAGSAGARSAT